MFSFENLDVWQKAISFANSVVQTCGNLNTKQKHYRLTDRLEASATSIAMNIAEGKGRNSRKEFIQFLYIARGSSYETITLLTVFQMNSWIT